MVVTLCWWCRQPRWGWSNPFQAQPVTASRPSTSARSLWDTTAKRKVKMATVLYHAVPRLMKARLRTGEGGVGQENKRYNSHRRLGTTLTTRSGRMGHFGRNRSTTRPWLEDLRPRLLWLRCVRFPKAGKARAETQKRKTVSVRDDLSRY